MFNHSIMDSVRPMISRYVVYIIQVKVLLKQRLNLLTISLLSYVTTGRRRQEIGIRAKNVINVFPICAAYVST